MSQPQQPSNGPIVGVTAIGLALVAVEARVQQQIEDDVQTALEAIGSILLIAMSLGLIATGTELLSRPDVHAGSVGAWDKARGSTRTVVEAGYDAGAQVAFVKARRDMKALGHEVPPELPPLDRGAIAQILADIDTAYGHAQTDMQNTVREAFDGVQGDDAEAARKLTVRKAVEKVGGRLAQRLQAAGSTAVHQGSTDAQNAIFAAFTETNPFIKVRKVWRVTSSEPCAMCEALDGTSVPVDADFDHQAGSDSKDWRVVWRDLQGPPRHPHCRCQLELVAT